MWIDAETNQDFLNFEILSGLVSEMIMDAKGKALSIGISGDWGVGKSSMICLIEDELRKRTNISPQDEVEQDGFVFVRFNAWLYQGFDDAKAALIEEVTRALLERSKTNATALDKVIKILKRIDIMRALQIGGDIAGSILVGAPVGTLLRGGKVVIDGLSDGNVSAEDLEASKNLASDATVETKALWTQPKKETPPEIINAIRRDFEKILKSLKVNLVVFVDDLDRCLPPTIIGTLEAMRLLLFMDHTAFVIAADERMIKAAVREHFPTASTSCQTRRAP